MENIDTLIDSLFEIIETYNRNSRNCISKQIKIKSLRLDILAKTKYSNPVNITWRGISVSRRGDISKKEIVIEIDNSGETAKIWNN